MSALVKQIVTKMQSINDAQKKQKFKGNKINVIGKEKVIRYQQTNSLNRSFIIFQLVHVFVVAATANTYAHSQFKCRRFANKRKSVFALNRIELVKWIVKDIAPQKLSI